MHPSQEGRSQPIDTAAMVLTLRLLWRRLLGRPSLGAQRNLASTTSRLSYLPSDKAT